MEKFFQNTKYWILNTIIFLFPLFFLPLTQEFYTTGKFYFLTFAVLTLILISGIEILVTKKITWQKSLFDNLLVLFFLTVAVSIIISSPNKIQALLNANFGPVMILSLIILYFYLSRLTMKQSNNITITLSISSFILSLLTIIFFFQPFKNINLPSAFQFLKNPVFTPIGSLVDLAIFLGFFVVLQTTEILTKEENKKNSLTEVFWIFNLVALSLAVYLIIKPPLINNQPSSTILPPLQTSWYAAVETLKNPITALFGVGIDNFSSIFTQVKDLAYNQSALWQIDGFNFSRSTILHIFTETGLFGLVAFALLMFSIIKQLTLKHPIIYSFVYLFICLLIFPPSLIVWFLFFMVISQLSSYELQIIDFQKQEIDLSQFMPIYLSLVLIILVVVGTAGYFLGRTYQAELAFKKSIDAVAKNNLKQLYDNQRQTVILNPYIERFRTNFSQTNLIIANNVASKVQNQQQTESAEQTQKSAKLTEQDRQTVAQAIQAAIAEAKAAVALNSQKAVNWENLAIIYRNIINVAQGADVWTVSAFQRAIVLDPQNPRYRLNLGGVYYGAGNWDEAIRMFQQAVFLKPDWPNVYYNLAWSYAKKEDYQQAAATMETVLKLVNPATDKTDYDKAQAELDEFKKKIPKQAEKPATTSQPQPANLNLPTPPATKIQPKIELPKNASPEAR